MGLSNEFSREINLEMSFRRSQGVKLMQRGMIARRLVLPENLSAFRECFSFLGSHLRLSPDFEHFVNSIQEPENSIQRGYAPN
jgi:hypothetical protein